MSYPYVKYPPLVEKYLNGEFPDLELLPIPSKPISEKNDFISLYVSLVTILILILLVLFNINNIFIYIFLVALLYFSLSSFWKDNKKINQRNKLKQEEYNYERKKAEIENKIRKVEKETLSKNGTLEQYAKKRIIEVLKTYTRTDLINWHYKQGLSECFFVKILFEYFGDNIKPFTKIITDYTFNYKPDFVFENESICIDIEIDEPYVLENRELIHLLDDSKESTRDSFFNMHNWCVIRFSEEQVLLYPFECCRYIANFIYDLTNDAFYFEKSKYRNNLIKTKRWTRIESSNLEKMHFRENLYLKAVNNASQLEYFSKNYFIEDGIILITFVSLIENYISVNPDVIENYIEFLNNNFQFTRKIIANPALFPNQKLGDTIQINLNDYEYKIRKTSDQINSSDNVRFIEIIKYKS